LIVDGGSAGCESGTHCPSARTPITVSLLNYERDGIDQPEVLIAEAKNDVVLDISSTCRESTADCETAGFLTPTIGPIRAGHDINLHILDGQQGNDPASVVGVSVTVTDSTGFSQSPNPNTYENDFHPDGDGTPPDPGLLAALGSTNTPVNTAYTFTDTTQLPTRAPGLVAGNDIFVYHDSTATDVTFTLYANG